MQLDGGTRLFLYQLVGTWGQLLFPRPWKEFRLWYDTHKTKGVKPCLDGMVRYFSPLILEWLLILIFIFLLELIVHTYRGVGFYLFA